MRLQRVESPALLNGWDAAHRFFSSCFSTSPDTREQLWVAHVDEAARCLHVQCFEGATDFVGMPVREIIVDAARLNSSGILLAHNHPSGNPLPSGADCRATRKLARAAEAIDLTILDHLIFAGSGCSSMRRMGLV
jgi:DNA repair protein RadC